MPRKKLEDRLVKQAAPALRHAELVAIAAEGRGGRFLRRVIELGFTREEARATLKLARFRSEFGAEAYAEFIDRTFPQHMLFVRAYQRAVSNARSESLKTTQKVAPPSVGTRGQRGMADEFYDKFLVEGTAIATSFLTNLLGGGDAWIEFDSTSTLPLEKAPLVIVIRRSPDPSAEMMSLRLGFLIKAMNWRTRHVLILEQILQKMLSDESTGERAYYRWRAAIRAVREYLKPTSAISLRTEAKAIRVCLALGRVFDIRPYALIEPLETASAVRSELIPVIQRLEIAGLTPAKMRPMFEDALKAPGLSISAKEAIEAALKELQRRIPSLS